MVKMCDVTVIIPALNEPYILKLVKKLSSYNVNVKSEKGLSYAVWCGIQQANSQIIVVMDGDGSHPTQVIQKMVGMLNKDVWLIVGSRYVKGGYSYDSLLRKLFSQFYCVLARIMLRSNIHDPMSGFWVGYQHAFKFEPSKTYKFGLQLIRKHQKHIKECPILFRKRKEGKSKVKPLQAVQDLLAILKR